MGSWSFDSFGNDTACDWAGNFMDDPTISKIKQAINEVIDCDEYLEMDQASECIAACEVIARLHGKPGIQNSYSEGIDNWVKLKKLLIDNKTKKMAAKALKRITEDGSELNELWQESEHYDNWKQCVLELIERVDG